jgi:hypothetical protein
MVRPAWDVPVRVPAKNACKSAVTSKLVVLPMGVVFEIVLVDVADASHGSGV